MGKSFRSSAQPISPRLLPQTPYNFDIHAYRCMFRNYVVHKVFRGFFFSFVSFLIVRRDYNRPHAVHVWSGHSNGSAEGSVSNCAGLVCHYVFHLCHLLSTGVCWCSLLHQGESLSISSSHSLSVSFPISSSLFRSFPIFGGSLAQRCAEGGGAP